MTLLTQHIIWIYEHSETQLEIIELKHFLVFVLSSAMSLIKNHWSPITYCYLVCFINLRQELNKHIIYLMTMFESSVCQFGITEVRGHSKHCPGKKKKGSLLRYPSYVLLDILEENIKGERGVISCWGENDKKWRQQCVLLSLSMFCLFCEGSVMRLNRCLLMDHRMPLVPSYSSCSSSSCCSLCPCIDWPSLYP